MFRLSSFLLLGSILGIANDYIQNTTIHVIDIAGTGVGDWEKVATNIAWSADGNRPGHWQVPRHMCATEIKLVHRSGYVSCNGNGNSNYGCGSGTHIAFHITAGGARDAMFGSKGWSGTIAPAPDDSSIHGKTSEGWWRKDGFTSASYQIWLDLPKKRYCFSPDRDYYIWYSEDYSNTEGGDNHGTTRDDVYLNVAPTIATTITTTTITTTTVTTTITTTTGTTTTTFREDNNEISDRVDVLSGKTAALADAVAAKADADSVTAMEQRLEAKINELTQKLKDQEVAHQEELDNLRIELVGKSTSAIKAAAPCAKFGTSVLDGIEICTMKVDKVESLRGN